MDSILGMPVYFSNHAFAIETEEVSRSWKERFFTRPWQPLLKTKFIDKKIPQLYIINFSLEESGLAQYVLAHSSFEKELEDNFKETFYGNT